MSLRISGRTISYAQTTTSISEDTMAYEQTTAANYENIMEHEEITFNQPMEPSLQSPSIIVLPEKSFNSCPEGRQQDKFGICRERV